MQKFYMAKTALPYKYLEKEGHQQQEALSGRKGGGIIQYFRQITHERSSSEGGSQATNVHML